MIPATLLETDDQSLTTAEQYQLSELEDTIERGLKTFVDVGTALIVVRDMRLYRQGYSTFEDYCQQRWSMHRKYAYKLISAAEVVNNLSPMGDILPTNERQARPLTQLEPDEQREVWQQAVDTAPNGKVTAAHVQSVVDEYQERVTYPQPPERFYPLTAANHAPSSDPDYDGDEWYTPTEYIDAARSVLGEIDLDPASCVEAQARVGALEYMTKEFDALRPEVDWFGRVWLNPPYSTPLIKYFVSKLIAQYEAGNVIEAIILTNNSSDTGWFHDLLSRYPACFTRGRAQFWRSDSTTFGARQGQTLFYLGNDFEAFRFTFSQIGQVVVKV